MLLDIVADGFCLKKKKEKKSGELNNKKKTSDSAETRCANGVFSALVQADGTGAWGVKGHHSWTFEKATLCGYEGASEGGKKSHLTQSMQSQCAVEIQDGGGGGVHCRAPPPPCVLFVKSHLFKNIPYIPLQKIRLWLIGL